MDSYRTVFVPAPRTPDGRPGTWAEEAPAAPPREVAGLRGTPPAPPEPEPKGQFGPAAARVDGPALARAVEEALDALSRDGFRLESLTPIHSGAYAFERDYRRHFETWFSAGAAYGYGYSFTEGVLLVARRA